MRRLALSLSVLALAPAPAPASASVTLTVADLQTGVVTTLASGTTAWSSLAWRPDGSLTATASGRFIYAYPPGGQPFARLRHGTDAQLRPAGDRIAAVSGNGHLMIRRLDGRLIRARDFRGQLSELAWSRDGRRLAAAWFDHRLRGHITVLGARGVALRTVTVPGDVSFSSTAWAPDGRTLAFAARPDRRDRPAQIRRLDVATGAQTVLLRGTRCGPPPLAVCELLDPPRVAPDGRHIALVRDLNAVTVLAPGARPQSLRIAHQPDGVFDAAWTPDGTALLVAYAQAHQAYLALVPRSGPARTVANVGHVTVSRLTVSPDGSRAAFTGTDDFEF
jgi:dipeptidyl aminopeptidase/acylaminoacyl peptidase